jgi:hypothetical protein
MNTRKALIPTLVLAAALLAPSALAQRPDDRAGARGPGAIAAQQSSSTRPDDRPGLRGHDGAAIRSTSVRPDDRAGMHGPGEFTPSVVQATSTGFDWGDALIGGLGGVGAALALMGILLLVTSRRSKARMA